MRKRTHRSKECHLFFVEITLLRIIEDHPSDVTVGLKKISSSRHRHRFKIDRFNFDGPESTTNILSYEKFCKRDTGTPLRGLSFSRVSRVAALGMEHEKRFHWIINFILNEPAGTYVNAESVGNLHLR